MSLTERVACPDCGKVLTRRGMGQHRAIKHKGARPSDSRESVKRKRAATDDGNPLPVEASAPAGPIEPDPPALPIEEEPAPKRRGFLDTLNDMMEREW